MTATATAAKEYDFEEARRRLAKIKQNRIAMPELTRGNKKDIRLAMQTLPPEDRGNVNRVTSAVMAILTEKFGVRDEDGTKYLGEGSDYQLSRAGMKTTADVRDKVECYLKQYGTSC